VDRFGLDELVGAQASVAVVVGLLERALIAADLGFFPVDIPCSARPMPGTRIAAA
jgi:hypothetical protein